MSDIPSRVNHEYDKPIWTKVYICIRVGDFFFFFGKSYLPRFLEDYQIVIRRREILLLFPLFLSAFARDISIDIEIDCYPMRIDITILSL